MDEAEALELYGVAEAGRAAVRSVPGPSANCPPWSLTFYDNSCRTGSSRGCDGGA
jgi:hypothetical protein